MPNQHHQDQDQASLQSVNYQQEGSSQQQEGNQKKNNTGIPDRLKAVIEHFSGFSLDKVRVHYNSDKPAVVGALAYAEGLDIYIGPGQEEHLAHELWHVVQQMKGEVKATGEVNGKEMNDENKLEQEAERVSKKVEQPIDPLSALATKRKSIPKGTIQRMREGETQEKISTTDFDSIVHSYPDPLEQNIDQQIDLRTLSQSSLMDDLLYTPVVSVWDSTSTSMSFNPTATAVTSSSIKQLDSKKKALDFLNHYTDIQQQSIVATLKEILVKDTSRALEVQAEHLLDALLENFDTGTWDGLDKILEHYVDDLKEKNTADSEKGGGKREEVRQFLSSLKGVRVGFEEGLSFGNIASGLTMIQSLKELGFKGGVTLVCPKSIYDKFKILKPDVEKFMKHEEQEAFEAENTYKKPQKVEEGVLSLLANGDLIDNDTNEKILNYMKSDVCLIMNPYGWEAGNGRRLLQRPTKEEQEDQGVKVTKMDKDIDQEALYSYPIENPKDLTQYIKDNLKEVMPAKAAGISGLVEAIKNNKVLLQPVYGLHALDDEHLANTEAYLSEGVKKAALQDGKPTVLLMLSGSRVDYLPQYQQDWLIRKKITDDDISDDISGMKQGEVMILDCGGLPNTVFTQVFKMASLPPLVEGANTSNLVQLIGTPWMSAKTNTTEFPFHKEKQYKKAIQILHDTRDALTGTSNITTTLKEDETYQPLVDYKMLAYKANQLQQLIEADGWEEAQYDCPSLYDYIKKIDNKYNGEEQEETIANSLEELTKQLGAITLNNLMRGKQFDPPKTEDLEALKTLATKKIAALKISIKDSLSETAYELDEKKIATISNMIQQAYTENSDLHTYFEKVKQSAKEEDRDQVLQGILLLMKEIPDF